MGLPLSMNNVHSMKIIVCFEALRGHRVASTQQKSGNGVRTTRAGVRAPAYLPRPEL
jgi:hypothetical protein